jgi:DNA-binding response OmpR family regulator
MSNSPFVARSATGTVLRALVVKVDADAAKSLTQGLRRRGYDDDDVDTRALALKTYYSADLVLLDLELSDLHGLEICGIIRAASDTLIIAVTSRSIELDSAPGPQAESDSYLVTPHGIPGLTDRVKTITPRARPQPHTLRTVSRGPLHIDPSIREVRVAGQPISVTHKEFDLLYLLASLPETVFTRKEIMAQAWGAELTRFSRTIDTHVYSLRKKLGANTWIITVRGVGFRLGGGS